ncbi:aldose epimerase family protein [Lichenihabitans psoromatis]|uniref:aldose epimerase family protein n=1 Tax=Lichenihabitans psoromatis TaxID=2528642 RepID=UPI001FE00F6B|nr:aldose epimerase family protein [Lichenihabitans psoromatis]
MSDAQMKTFGVVDGLEVQEIILRADSGASVSVLSWGAVIRDMIVPSRSGLQRVVLGLNSIDDYVAHSPYFGAVPGRFANRIAGGFTLDGKRHDLACNEKGITCLHGGPKGFGVRVWTVKAHTTHSVTLTLRSDDGDQGFPGTLDATCTYTLIEPATLRIELTATSDAATVVNLTNHSYFNLDGSTDILDHDVTIFADRMTPVDTNSIPTGEIAPVEGTPFDFREARPVRHEAIQVYDINYVLRGGRFGGALDHAATVHSSKSDVTLQVHTDQPGVQFYNAAFLNCPVPGLDGATYDQFGALCLETQFFPDSPNQPTFPSTVLRPGEVYSHRTEFRFS